MLKLINVSKSFHKGQNKRDIFNNISIEFPKTGIVYITGESGVGKSTLLNIIAAIEYPTSGEISYNNQKIQSLDFRKNVVSYLFQEFNLFKDLSIYENLNVSSITSIEDTKRVMKLMNLEMKESTRVKYLSLGEQQRLALARSILKKYEIFLLDEPTSSLDNKNAEILMECVKEISKDKLVIIISHKEEDITKYGDYKIEIKDKTIKGITEIKKDESLVVGSTSNKDYNFNNNKEKGFSLGLRFKYALRLIGLHKIKFLLSICMLGLIGSMSIKFINCHILTEKTAIKEAIKKENAPFVSISDKNSLYTYPPEITKNLKNLTSLDFKDLYLTSIENDDQFDYRFYAGKEDKYADLIEGKLPTNKFEILVSEEANKIFKKSTIRELIGEKHKYKNSFIDFEFTICGVIKKSEVEIKPYFLTTKENLLSIIDSDGIMKFREGKTLLFNNQQLLTGNDPKYGEVVISNQLLGKFDFSSPESALNKKILLHKDTSYVITSKNKNIKNNNSENNDKREYKVVGVINDSKKSLYFSNHQMLDFKNEIINQSFIIEAKTKTINTDKLIDNEFQISSLNFKVIHAEYSAMKNIGKLLLFLNIFFLTMIVLLVSFYANVTIRNKKRELFIIKSLGISNIKIFSLFFLHNLMYTIFGFTCGIIISKISDNIMDNMANKVTSLVNISFLTYVIFYLIAIVISFLSTLLSMLKIRRISISTAIKES